MCTIPEAAQNSSGELFIHERRTHGSLWVLENAVSTCGYSCSLPMCTSRASPSDQQNPVTHSSAHGICRATSRLVLMAMDTQVTKRSQTGERKDIKPPMRPGDELEFS